MAATITPEHRQESQAAPGEFDYIAERIETAEFQTSPFRHLLIEDFLSKAHFDLVTSNPQIALPSQPTTEALIETLHRRGYKVQKFPGCTTDIADYLKRLESGVWHVDKLKQEAFGLAFRLQAIEDPTIARLTAFLNGPVFKSALEQKFGITRENRIETAIQKYLTGYEISPHPDVRSKCITYLLNINTCTEAATARIHTHLLKFKPEREFIYSFWENNRHIDTTWVPWDWCTTEKCVTANNSMVIFETHSRSLHAIKLDYDHTKFQRTQIYGNLWYTDVPRVALLLADHGAFDIRGRLPHAPKPKMLRTAKQWLLDFAGAVGKMYWR